MFAVHNPSVRTAGCGVVEDPVFLICTQLTDVLKDRSACMLYAHRQAVIRGQLDPASESSNSASKRRHPFTNRDSADLSLQPLAQFATRLVNTVLHSCDSNNTIQDLLQFRAAVITVGPKQWLCRQFACHLSSLASTFVRDDTIALAFSDEPF